MRTVFAGTPDFAVPSLHLLLTRPELDLVGVYTQPDRPAGRGRAVLSSPVKRAAEAAGLPVLQPEKLGPAEAQAAFAALRCELLVVAAYGLMLPATFIEPPIVALNVHASLLPRWRGAAPIQRALLAGDTVSGISIMRVVARLDAGPVWLRRECPIDAGDTGGSLHDRLAALGAEALATALDALRDGNVSEVPQDEQAVTYAHKLTAADRELDWRQDAAALERRVRALQPLPAAVTRLAGQDVKVHAARVVHGPAGAAPGTVVEAGAGGIVVATGAGALALTELQPAGRQRMDAQAFLNGYGARL